MANYFDQFDEPAHAPEPQAQANFFDQFDPPERPNQSFNFFDQFDEDRDREEVRRQNAYQQQQQVQPVEPARPPSPEQPPQPEAEGMLATAARRAAHSVLPSAAFWPGFTAGSALAAPAGIAAPVVGGLPGGLATSAAVGALQETGLKAMGFDDSQQMAVNAAANPWSATAGDIIGALPSFGFGKGAQLVARGIGAIAGGGLEAGAQYLHEGEVDPTRVAGAAVAGGALIKPRALTEALGARAAAAGEALRTKVVESWHGSAGSTAAAGTAQEHPPPSTRPDDLPQPSSGEVPPAAALPEGYQISHALDESASGTKIHTFEVRDANGREVATAEIKDGDNFISNIEVRPEDRRQGIATALYRHIEDQLGVKLRPADVQTSDAEALWRSRRPAQTFEGGDPAIRMAVEGTPITPRVFEGEEVARPSGQVDTLLQGRGFSPEQIQALSPDEKTTILQRREGEAGAGPPGRTADDIELDAEHGRPATLAEMERDLARASPKEIATEYYADVGQNNHVEALKLFDQDFSARDLAADPKLAAARDLIARAAGEPPAPITQQLEQEFPRVPGAERQQRPLVEEPPAAAPTMPARRETIGDILKRQEATPTDPDLLRQRAARLREIGAEGMARQHELAADAIEQAQGGRRPGPEAPDEVPPVAQQQQQKQPPDRRPSSKAVEKTAKAMELRAEQYEASANADVFRGDLTRQDYIDTAASLRRQAAAVRAEMGQPERGITAPAPKGVDPATQALIKDALAKRAAAAPEQVGRADLIPDRPGLRRLTAIERAAQQAQAAESPFAKYSVDELQEFARSPTASGPMKQAIADELAKRTPAVEAPAAKRERPRTMAEIRAEDARRRAADPALDAFVREGMERARTGDDRMLGKAGIAPEAPTPSPAARPDIRQAGEFRVELNPEGGHLLMRGDQVVSQHPNLGQAFIAMNKAAKAEGIVRGPAPGEGPAARAPAEKAGRKEGPLPAAAEPAGVTPPAGAVPAPKATPAQKRAYEQQIERQIAQAKAMKKPVTPTPAQPTPAAGPAAAGQPAARARGRPLRQQPTPAAPAQAGAPPAGGPPAPPAAGAPPQQPPPRPPRQRLVPAGPDGDKEAFNAAQRADDDLHRLTTVPAADAQNYIRNLKQAGQQYPDIALTGGERIYKALERGTFDQLPVKLKQGYNIVAKPLIDEAVNIRNELVKRGEIDAEAFDPKYVHRIVKSQPTEIADPINEGRLPGMFDPSSTKELGVRGAEAKDGTRLVISSGEEKISIWNRGNQNFIDNPHGRTLKTGDTFVHDGKTYTVDRGLSNEIERHATHEDGTPIQYHQNAFLSAFDYNRQMKMMKAYADWKDNFKDPQNSPFREYMTRNGEEAIKRGWRQSEIPAFQGLYFHPHLEQVLHNNYNPGMGWRGSQGLNALRAINQFAVRSIFWNPVPHSMNALMHYAVSRGGDWLPMPKNDYGRNWVRSMQDAWDAVIRQGPLLQDLNRAGASLIMSKIDSQNMGENIGRVLDIDLRNNPGKWEQFARDWKLGTGADAVKAIYNGSQRLLWTFSDVLMAARIRELEMNNPGMSRLDAIAKARIHMPDYRVPIEFMGSHQMVRAMTDRNLSIFGRYHMGVFQSLGHMFGDLIGTNATLEQRKEAFGNVMALGVLGFIVKPILDGAVRLITGNEEAETRARGPLGPIKSGIETVQGRQDPGMALSNIFTFSPAVRQISQTIFNRDFAGRRIVEPGSTLPQKALQYAEYTAGNVLSPYGTFGGTFQPGSSKGNILHELGTQLTDTRVPTQKQIQGKQYGELVTKREAETRARKPRGLLEYTLGPGAPERQ